MFFPIWVINLLEVMEEKSKYFYLQITRLNYTFMVELGENSIPKNKTPIKRDK